MSDVTSDPRVGDCVAFGYSILLPRPRPDWARKELPERIISGSGCLKTDLTDVWLDAWREREGDLESVYRDAQDQWGLSRQAVDELCFWYQTKPEVDMNALRSLSAAQEVVRQLLPDRDDIAIVGLGLPRASVDELFLAAATGDTKGAPAGISELIIEALKRNEPLANGGTVLGYEPLVIDGGLACSWICNGIDREADQKLQINTNAFGLIERLDDASRVVRYIDDDGHAEPGLWLPWLAVRYPL